MNDDDTRRLIEQFKANGGKVTVAPAVRKVGYGADRHGASASKDNTDIVGQVHSTRALTYRSGKYAGHLVVFSSNDGTFYNFMSSRDFATRLILSRHYRLSVNLDVEPYPTGKDSGVKIDGAIKRVPVMVAAPSPQGPS